MLSTNQFRFDKASRNLVASVNTFNESYLGGFPVTMEIHSPKTGNVCRFFIDAAAAERNEYWDGEEMQYISAETDVRVILHCGE
jgi:hypothetical protein